MRQTFIKTLIKNAKIKKEINLITADLGFHVVEPFVKIFPDRYLNVGVAEQNMIGIAAGMSKINKRIVFVYSIVNFATLRCLEHIRNDICMNNTNVKIVAVGGGVAYGPLGYTHYAVEDIAVLRALPNIIVTSPSDPRETEAIIELACDYNGPWYIRLGTSGEPIIHQNRLNKLKIGDTIQIGDGKDVSIISTGSITYQAFLALNMLEREGIHGRLISMPFLKPFKKKNIIKAIEESKCIITVEEHRGVGGLKSIISEIIAENKKYIKFYNLYIPDKVLHIAGEKEYIYHIAGIDAQSIKTFILKKCIR